MLDSIVDPCTSGLRFGLFCSSCLDARTRAPVHNSAGDEQDTTGLENLGLPKSVMNEMQTLSVEEQNMILGAVGLAPGDESALAS